MGSTSIPLIYSVTNELQAMSISFSTARQDFFFPKKLDQLFISEI